MTDALIDALARHMQGDVPADLPELLRQAGCAMTAALLVASREGREAAEAGDRTVRLGSAVPRDGDWWFDPADLSLMVMVQSGQPSAAMARWVSAEPVRSWQFEAFRRIVRLGPSRSEFPSPADVLSRPARGLGWIGDVYQDEALAYAHWFGKGLAGQFDWLDARDTLSPPVFADLLPAGRAAWEEAEYPLSEFVRVAVRAETLDKAPTDEQAARLSGAHGDAPDRMLFEEWERQPEIGFSTLLWATRGRTVEEPPRTLFFDLERVD